MTDKKPEDKEMKVGKVDYQDCFEGSKISVDKGKGVTVVTIPEALEEEYVVILGAFLHKNVSSKTRNIKYRTEWVEVSR